MATISYIGIGSNMGDRKENINMAIKLLTQEKIKVKKISRIIETDPLGGPRQAKFLNAAIKITTDLNPRKLLDVLKKIEKKMGRKKTVRSGPRPIDLDILFYGKKVIKSKKLTIPHPRMLERNFVMVPLLEIAPNNILKEFIK